ncbi:hypothetical protein [Enterobacter roggenkampii]|uniref:hypothetical protein n=1 Tax=Enterobacter roggenkampii TaxID=1812935 RepID=UPI002003A344|nr:hypothetical protein [Enterobacter roggenkampii]MCK6942965.1 hypothetical protein [Enterobacter roggenkampii]
MQKHTAGRFRKKAITAILLINTPYFIMADTMQIQLPHSELAENTGNDGSDNTSNLGENGGDGKFAYEIIPSQSNEDNKVTTIAYIFGGNGEACSLRAGSAVSEQ